MKVPPANFRNLRVGLEDDAQPTGRLKVSINPRLAATPQWLVKIKELLPTAVRLANEMDPAEAHKFLKTVHGTVSKGLQAAQLRNDSTKFKPALTTALTAVQRLHEVASEKAARFLLGDKILHAFLELELWESDVMVAASELQGDMMQQTEEPS